jgi:hypothetical protein
MKTILALIAALALFATGCKTNSTDTQKVARVAVVAEMAAFSGTSVYLKAHPENRPYFNIARESLHALAATNGITPASFAEALKGLPIKELQGDTGTLVVGNAVVLYDMLAREHVNLDANIWLRPVVESVERGMARALETPPPAQ